MVHYFLSILFITTFFSQITLAAAQHTTDIHAWSHSIKETVSLVTTKSYFPLPIEQAVIKALDAFTHNDDYSRFLGPKEYTELLKTTHGEFYGTGIILAPKKTADDFLLVLDCVPGSPAYTQQIQRYDKILAVDNCSLAPLSVEEAVSKLKGDQQYSPVTLTLMRGEKGPFKVTLKRDKIKEESVFGLYFPKQRVAYCALSLFTQQVARQLESIVHKALAKKPQGLIIDLRDNAGGILQAAVDCAGLFLPKKSLIVTTQDRNRKVLESFFTDRQPVVPAHLVIIVLVNNYTASAGEILAGALQHYATTGKPGYNSFIITVGTSTYGKGSVQEVIPVGNNCAVKLTTSLYYLPAGISIENTGITPDIICKQKYGPTTEMKLLDTLYAKKNQQKIKRKKDIQWQQEKIKVIKNDYQLQCALSMIASLNLKLSIPQSTIKTHSQAVEFLTRHLSSSKYLQPQRL
ncbi:PDZ domain-containing protein [Candidatus Dependentiae bacterium]|nr:PDZ domain-containing protein [Candidatus Dependentiae bacterium]